MSRLRLRSPKFEDASIDLPVEASHLHKSFQAVLCSPKGDEYRVEKNIVRLDEGVKITKTVAQESNFFRATAAGYEDLWRTRALTYFAGEDFPLEREQELLLDWCNPQPAEITLDAACSTGLYGRFLLAKEPSLALYAVDFSPAMLEEARLRFVQEHKQAYLICADVQQLPFWAGSFDLIVCGGSLNEFNDPVKALYELRRVLTKNGRAFFMYLTEASTIAGKLLQRAASTSGIQFFSPSAARDMFERCGFKVAQVQQRGVVGFALLEPA
jgi:SAM-dependent methyltransferase